MTNSNSIEAAAQTPPSKADVYYRIIFHQEDSSSLEISDHTLGIYNASRNRLEIMPWLKSDQRFLEIESLELALKYLYQLHKPEARISLLPAVIEFDLGLASWLKKISIKPEI